MRQSVLSLLSRIAAALFGGYALAAAFSIWLSFILPMTMVDAVLTGLLVSFAVYTAAILWCFAVATAARAWIGITVTTVFCAGGAGLAVLMDLP